MLRIETPATLYSEQIVVKQGLSKYCLKRFIAVTGRVLIGSADREYRPTVADSFAIDAASNTHSCLYRSGYDVSLPLAPKKRFDALAEIAPSDRAFLLTFKVHARAAATTGRGTCSGQPLDYFRLD